MRYLRSTRLDRKDIGIRKSEFVTRTQFLWPKSENNVTLIHNLSNIVFYLLLEIIFMFKTFQLFRGETEFDTLYIAEFSSAVQYEVKPGLKSTKKSETYYMISAWNLVSETGFHELITKIEGLFKILTSVYCIKVST